MDTPTFNPSDIVKFAAAKDAVNISTAFDQMIGQRVYDAIEARRKEVAAAMFNSDAEQSDSSADETTDGVVDSAAEEQDEAGADEQTTETEESDETAEQNT